MLNKYEKKKCGLGDPSNGLHDPAYFDVGVSASVGFVAEERS